MQVSVGFGRENITPDFPVLLAGGGYSKRISTNLLDALFVSCIAFTDADGSTALIASQDLLGTYDGYTLPAREAVAKATGIPFDRIFFSASHTHSGPTLNQTAPGGPEMLELYFDKIVKAALAALADRSEAEFLAGSTQAPGMTFVRRYKLADGTYEGASGNTTTCTTRVDHAYPSDETVQLLRICRKDKADILFVNLGAHATFNGATSKTNLSSDFPHALRQRVEAESGCLCAYFMSAAGDQTPTTRLEWDNHGLDHRQYGDRIGQLVLQALPTLTPVAGGKVRANREVCTVKTNKRDMDKLELATQVWNYFDENGFKVGNPYAHEKGFASVYEARAIMTHAQLPDTKDIAVHAMAVGDVSFAFASYEMYSENGRFVRENTPFPFTFVITQANGGNGYLQSKMGYFINCYEAYASNVAEGTGEQVADLFVEMLKKLKDDC